MSSKKLKVFSAVSFALPFLGVHLFALAMLLDDLHVIGNVPTVIFVGLSLLMVFVGFSLAVTARVQGHKNIVNGKTGDLKVLSIPSLVFNSIALAFAILFIGTGIASAFRNVNRRTNEYKITGIEKQERGVYVCEEFYKTISSRKSYLKLFNENKMNDAYVYAYNVDSKAMFLYSRWGEYCYRLDSSDAEYVSFVSSDGEKLISGNGKTFYKIADSAKEKDFSEAFSKALLDLYIGGDSDELLSGYTFECFPETDGFTLWSNPDFIVSRKTGGGSRQYYTAKIRKNSVDFRRMINEDGKQLELYEVEFTLDLQ